MCIVFQRLNELDTKTQNSKFNEISEQIKVAVSDNPSLSAMFSVVQVLEQQADQNCCTAIEKY